ncbi:MAG TPA: GAF domain-containing protein, partial [Candidatus Binatia bacterium]|nr:GAF domain-containing protein [Candidatus Binatia bacterium]
MKPPSQKGSKSTTAKPRPALVKKSPPKRGQTIAELRQELAQSLEREKAAAIENARLVQERETRNRDLSALHAVTAAASQSLEIKPVLDEVVKKITEIFAFDSVSIYLFDPQREYLNPVAAVGTNEEAPLPRVFRRGSLTGRVAETGEPILFENLQTDPRYQELSQTKDAQQRDYCFFAIFPIKSKQRFLGTINCLGKQPRQLIAEEIRLIRSMCDQIGVAVENINLFEEVRNKTAELESSNSELREALEHQTATSEVLGIISRSPTDVQPVLDAIVESAARVCGIDDVVLRLARGNAWVLQAHFGSMPIRRIEIDIDEANVRWIREHGTLYIPDVRAQQNDFPTVGTLSGWRTFLSAPLRQQGKLIGSLNARRIEVRPFTPAQIKLLETFADQAVIAIENVRLFNELKESLEQQTAMSEILGVIASSPTDIQPVLDVVAENAARLCDSSDSQIYRVDGDMLQPVAAYGPMPIPPIGLITRGWPAGRAVIDRQTIHVHDLVAEIETEFPESKTRQSLTGARTSLVTPLLREGVPIGVIIIRRTEVRPFTEKQIALLKTFADQAVIAIENVRLFQELEARTRELARSVGELKALGDVGQAVSSTLDLQTVLSTIVGHAVQLSGTDGGVIYEYDESREEFELRASHRMEEEVFEALKATPIRLGQGATGQAATIQAPVQVANILEERESTAIRVRPVLARLGYRSVLAVPLLREERILGALTVWRKETGSFSLEVVNLLQTFATQSALAIQNARLFREI